MGGLVGLLAGEGVGNSVGVTLEEGLSDGFIVGPIEGSREGETEEVGLSVGAELSGGRTKPTSCTTGLVVGHSDVPRLVGLLAGEGVGNSVGVKVGHQELVGPQVG